MLFELEDEADDGAEALVWVDEVAAGADELAAGVDDELLELDPQAAAASAAPTSSSAVHPRMDRVLIVFMIAPVGKKVGADKDRLLHRTPEARSLFREPALSGGTDQASVRFSGPGRKSADRRRW